jgi:hypothetical protein
MAAANSPVSWRPEFSIASSYDANSTIAQYRPSSSRSAHDIARIGLGPSPAASRFSRNSLISAEISSCRDVRYSMNCTKPLMSFPLGIGLFC